VAADPTIVGTPIRIWMCDYAAVNPDGTVTMVRGGVEKWAAPNLPGAALTWIYVEVDPGFLQIGDHQVHVRIVNAGGVRLAETTGQLKVPPSVGSTPVRFALPMSVLVQAYGELRAIVEIGGFTGERKVQLEPTLVSVGVS
jgi:hypothetical protein